MTHLSSLYGLIMGYATNATGHGNNVVDGLNATFKRYLKGQMEFLDKLSSNDTSEIVILPSASKYVSIKFA